MLLKNKFGIARAILLFKLFNKKIPLNVMWRITDRCNLRCKYCDLPLRNKKELGTQQILNLIDQMAKAGVERIGFVGGEPLLRNDIKTIIDYASKKKLYLTLVSNGYLIPHKIDAIKNINYLVLSLDGKKSIHDINRGSGSFDNVINAIKIATKHLPVLTYTVITKKNINSIDYILSIARKYNFNALFSPIQGYPKLRPFDTQYETFFKQLILRKRQGFPVAMSYTALNILLKWKDFGKPIIFNKEKTDLWCFGGQLFCDLDTDGVLYPCRNHYLFNKYNPNVLEHGFKNAFEIIMSNRNCKYCICYFNLIEYNNLFSLKLNSILNWLKLTAIK